MEFKNNPLTKGASGMLGGMLVFRTWNGKTFGSSRPKKPTRESALQKETRSRFKRAIVFAKGMMADPLKKAEYQEIAKRLTLPNAYTAAITEFMRKPEIVEADTTRYTGKSEETLNMTVKKKGFEVQEVEVDILDKNGKSIEEGKAVKGLGNEWIYKTTVNSEISHFHQLLIKAKDRVGNIIEKRL